MSDSVDSEEVDGFVDAANQGNLAAVSEILDRSPGVIDSISESGWFYRTALTAAAEHGHLDTVKYLVETGHASVDMQDGDGWTALMRAVCGHFALAASLTGSEGTNVNKQVVVH